MRLKAGAVWVGSVMLPLMALAHHSNQGFYLMDETIEVAGIVTSWQLINPHPELVIEITEENGETSEMRVYALTTGGVLQKQGWTSESLVAGDRVTVVGHASRSGDASMAGKSIVKPDGTTASMTPR